MMNMLGKLQDQLSDKFESLFDSVISGKSDFYNNNPDKRPGVDNIDKIINNYANMNAVVTGGLNLVPGPWAIATAVPEVVLLVRNQVMMVYELGVAHGKEKFMTKELILSMLMSSLGVGTIGVATAQVSKFVIGKVAANSFKNMLPVFSGKISQRVLQGIIGGMVPVVGSAALAAWSRFYTKRIGRQAVAYLSGTDMEDEGHVSDDENFTEATHIVESEIARLRLRAFLNLVRADGSVSSLEKEYIQSLIEGSDINEMEKITLMEAIKHHDNFDLDLEQLKSRRDVGMNLLNEMIALAKRDASINQAEKSYIMEIGSMLGYSQEEIKDLMDV